MSSTVKLDGKSKYTGIHWHFLTNSGHNCCFSKSTSHVAKKQQASPWSLLAVSNKVKFSCEGRACSSTTATYQCMLTLKCCCQIMCDVLSSCSLYFIVSQVICTTVYSSAQIKQFPFQIIGKVHAWGHRKILEFSSHFSACFCCLHYHMFASIPTNFLVALLVFLAYFITISLNLPS